MSQTQFPNQVTQLLVKAHRVVEELSKHIPICLVEVYNDVIRIGSCDKEYVVRIANDIDVYINSLNITLTLSSLKRLATEVNKLIEIIEKIVE